MQWSRITALVLSIISIFLSITVYAYFISLYLAPVAMIFAIVAIVMTNNHNKVNPEKKESNSMGITSLILSIIALVIAIALLFLDGMALVGEYKVMQDIKSISDEGGFSDLYCDETIEEGEQSTCGDITITFDGYSNKGNTYEVDYTIENNGDTDYEYDMGYDPIIKYSDLLGYDFAEEQDIEVIEPNEEKSLTSTFEAEEGKVVEKIAIEVENGDIYLYL